MASVGSPSTQPYSPLQNKEFAPSQIHAMTVERTFKEHTSGVTGLAILDRDHFISCSSDKTIKIWEKSLDKSQDTRQIDDKHGIWTMQLLNSICLAMGWDSGVPSNEGIRIYNLVDGKHHDLENNQPDLTSLAVSNAGLLASGSKQDGSVKIWEPFSSQNLHSYRHGFAVFCVGFSPDGKTVVCGSEIIGQKYQIQMWEITSNKPDNRPPDKIFQNNCQVSSLLVMKDGRIVTGSVDGMVRVWDPSESGEKALKREMKGHSGNVTALAERIDHLIVSGSNDKTIILWNVDTGESWPSLEAHTGEIHAVAAFDDNKIITASFDRTVKLWV